MRNYGNYLDSFTRSTGLVLFVLFVIGFVMGVCWSLSDYIWESIKGKFKKEDEES